MSLSIDPKNGVRVKTSRKPGKGIAALIIVLEAVFSVFLYMSLAEKVFVVIPAAAQPGVPEYIAYQGLLTDSSGNPLGGAGSVYCFRYSLWDAQSGGDQLWPQPALGDASTTPSNSTTTVTNGKFSDEIGRVDTLTGLDFGADTNGTSTYYLQVQVSTSSLTCASGLETLSPRQQIASDAWSQTAQNVYSSELRTLVSNNVVQVGTGGGEGAGSQTLLSLDVVNVTSSESIGGTCSQNGTLWYDSTLKRALVCENLQILPISNGSTTIGGIGTNASSAITAGSVVFSNGNNVTFGQNGSTITANATFPSVTQTLSQFEWPPAGASESTIAMASNGAVSFAPIFFNKALSGSKAYALISFSISTTTITSTSRTAGQSVSIGIGVYTLNGNSSNGTLSTVTTGSSLYSYTYSSNLMTASLDGVRQISIPITVNAPPGNYWYGVWVRTSSTSTFGMSISLFGGYPLNTTIYSGNFASATATSQQFMPGLGLWSTTTAALPGSVALNAISEQGTAVDAKIPYIIFSNY